RCRWCHGTVPAPVPRRAPGRRQGNCGSDGSSTAPGEIAPGPPAHPAPYGSTERGPAQARSERPPVLNAPAGPGGNGEPQSPAWTSSSMASRASWRHPPPFPRCWRPRAWPGDGWRSRSTAPSSRAAGTASTSWPGATGSRSCTRSAAGEFVGSGRSPRCDNRRMSENSPHAAHDPLVIAGVSYESRLLTGTGKFKDLDETRRATDAAGARIVTVAIRRTNIGQDPGEPNLLDVLPPEQYTILPNTAGCYTAEEAVRTLRLARELLDGRNLVKLEVLGDQKTLYPDVVQTLKAAELLVADGFDVMVYTSDDPILAKRLEEIGCVAVMPLAAPIGSGLGIQNKWSLLEIVENAKVPII